MHVSHFQLILSKLHNEYQPSGAEDSHLPPAMPYQLQNPKWLLVVPKIADGVLGCVYPYVFGHSRLLLLNKFFDHSTPSMRKEDDGEKGKKEIR